MTPIEAPGTPDELQILSPRLLARASRLCMVRFSACFIEGVSVVFIEDLSADFIEDVPIDFVEDVSVGDFAKKLENVLSVIADSGIEVGSKEMRAMLDCKIIR